jgi:hypothetical protein
MLSSESQTPLPQVPKPQSDAQENGLSLLEQMLSPHQPQSTAQLIWFSFTPQVASPQ